MISLVIPVYNEALILEPNILRLFNFCQNNLSEPWQIIISDNQSSDATGTIAQNLASRYSAIKYFHLDQRGKGRAVMTAWQNFPADIYVFMDADLSVDLTSLPTLIAGLKAGADIVVGSRFITGSSVERSLARRAISVFLRLVLKILFGLKVQDAPCGFKAVKHRVIDQLVPQIKNQTWFFDTELIILAERADYKIQEIPVVWQEPPASLRCSKVFLPKVIFEYLKNIFLFYGRIKRL